MFAIISNGIIALLIPAGTAFEWDSIQYPANWCNLSSPEEKANIGMVDVVYAARPDDRYYWVSEASPVIADGVVSIGYTSTPKDLAGLLDQAITAVNDAAGGLLAPSDYMILKSIENSSAVSPAWLAWRSEIRVQAKAQKALLAEIYSVEQLLAVPQVIWANDPNYVAPVEIANA
jgi:hypothetical protein